MTFDTSKDRSMHHLVEIDISRWNNMIYVAWGTPEVAIPLRS